MREIRFVIPAAGVGKGRPRVAFRSNGRVIAYTPKKTREFEAFVRLCAQRACSEPVRSPVSVDMTIEFSPPSSWSAKRKQAAIAGEIPHLSRPDLDNVTKAVLDGIVGVAIEDDRQVVELLARKRYAEADRVVVVIRAIKYG